MLRLGSVCSSPPFPSLAYSCVFPKYTPSLCSSRTCVLSTMALHFILFWNRLNIRNNIRRARMGSTPSKTRSGERGGGVLYLETRPSGKDTTLPYFVCFP